MNRVIATIGGAVLIVLGVGLFPFAVLGFLYGLSGVSAGFVIVVIDAALLVLGATGIAGLWSHHRSN